MLISWDKVFDRHLCMKNNWQLINDQIVGSWFSVDYQFNELTSSHSSGRNLDGCKAPKPCRSPRETPNRRSKQLDTRCYPTVLLSVWPKHSCQDKTCHPWRSPVSMALQSSLALVPHLHRTQTNRAQGQMYSWVEQHATSGLHLNTARAKINWIQTTVEISHRQEHKENLKTHPYVQYIFGRIWFNNDVYTHKNQWIHRQKISNHSTSILFNSFQFTQGYLVWP